MFRLQLYLRNVQCYRLLALLFHVFNSSGTSCVYLLAGVCRCWPVLCLKKFSGCLSKTCNGLVPTGMRWYGMVWSGRRVVGEGVNNSLGESTARMNRV